MLVDKMLTTSFSNREIPRENHQNFAKKCKISFCTKTHEIIKIKFRNQKNLLAKIGFDTAENEPSKFWPACLPA